MSFELSLDRNFSFVFPCARESDHWGGGGGEKERETRGEKEGERQRERER